jgi:hypothetical protein
MRRVLNGNVSAVTGAGRGWETNWENGGTETPREA